MCIRDRRLGCLDRLGNFTAVTVRQPAHEAQLLSLPRAPGDAQGEGTNGVLLGHLAQGHRLAGPCLGSQVQGQGQVVQIDILDLAIQPGAIAHHAQAEIRQPFDGIQGFGIVTLVFLGTPDAFQALLEAFRLRLHRGRRRGRNLPVFPAGKQRQRCQKQQGHPHQLRSVILHYNSCNKKGRHPADLPIH